MRKKPACVVFDAIGTLFSLDPLRLAFVDTGLPSGYLDLVLARTLRDGFALDAAGLFRKFSDLFRANVRTVLSLEGRTPDDSLLDELERRFAVLPTFPDARPAVQAIRSAGLRCWILTNASEKIVRDCLAHDGLAGLVEDVTSIEHVFRWKPAREVYHHAARAIGAHVDSLVMVASHAWDLAGAHEAGLMTAFVRRTEEFPDDVVPKPDLSADSLLDIAKELGADIAEPLAPPGP